MAVTTMTRGRLRRLAELRPEHGRVLSVFVDLDPREFATPPARASQINSVLDEAAKQIEANSGLDQAERKALRADIERIHSTLQPVNLGAGGVRGLAVYACGPADLLEIVRLPHTVESGFIINDSPHVEPLAVAGERERWCVVLANRRNGRILFGNEDSLEEIGNVFDDTKGQHDQGGWSQARFQRSVEKEKTDHLDNLADALLELSRRRPFTRLLIAAPSPLDDELESRLHPYVAETLAGRVQVDVENSSAADVLAAAAPVFEEHRRAKERDALERLRAGLGREDGRAAGGREDVRAALEQARVEVLLVEPGNGIPDPLREEFIESALEQSADVLVIHHFPDLGTFGGVAALLRF